MVDKQDLVITHRFDAPIASVWEAWSNPDLVRQWWGPDGFSSPHADIDFREGGTSLVCMRAPKEFGGQDYFSTWTYTKIIPGEQIEYVHNLTDATGQTIDPTTMGMPAEFPQGQRHVVHFADGDEGTTELTITEYAWPVGQLREMSRKGMEQCLAKMAQILPPQ